MDSWQTISRRTVLDRGKYVVVEEHTVRLPGGRTINDWPWLVLPEYVNVVAETEDGKFLFFRQTKYAVEGITLAPVGGYCEPETSPLENARRELLEETGYEAPEWFDLGHYAVDGNRGAGIAHLFLARKAKPSAAPESDDLEEQELVLLTRQETMDAVIAGEFKVLAWSAAVALAMLRPGR